VDPDEEISSGGRFETFDANLRFAVVRDEDGYAVWRLEEMGEGEPIERFSDDDEGYEAAGAAWKQLTKQDIRDRGVWLGRLRLTALVGLALWVLTYGLTSVLNVFLYLRRESSFAFGDDPLEDGTFEVWLGAVSSVVFAIWVAALLSYVLLWLERRRQD
jgi:hypothetical protein